MAGRTMVGRTMSDKPTTTENEWTSSYALDHLSGLVERAYQQETKGKNLTAHELEVQNGWRESYRKAIVHLRAHIEKRDALKAKVDCIEKMAEVYRMTIVKLGDERDALKAEVGRLHEEHAELDKLIDALKAELRRKRGDWLDQKAWTAYADRRAKEEKARAEKAEAEVEAYKENFAQTNMALADALNAAGVPNPDHPVLPADAVKMLAGELEAVRPLIKAAMNVHNDAGYSLIEAALAYRDAKEGK